MVPPTLPDHLVPDLLERLATRMEPFPLIRDWEIQLLGLAPGAACLRLGATPHTVNPDGKRVNGGVLATLADMACALALSTAFDGNMPFSTADLHIRYLEPVEGAVEAEATVLRLSSRSAVLECKLRGNGAVVALCTCQFSLKLGG